MHKKARYILAALHLLVIMFWLSGTTLFVHSHNIDGKGIVHSHPYAGNAEDHGHNTSDIIQISRLADLDIIIYDSPVNDNHLIAKHIDEVADIAEHIRTVDLLATSLRAPPAVA